MHKKRNKMRGNLKLLNKSNFIKHDKNGIDIVIVCAHWNTLMPKMYSFMSKFRNSRIEILNTTWIVRFVSKKEIEWFIHCFYTILCYKEKTREVAGETSGWINNINEEIRLTIISINKNSNMFIILASVSLQISIHHLHMQPCLFVFFKVDLHDFSFFPI